MEKELERLLLERELGPEAREAIGVMMKENPDFDPKSVHNYGFFSKLLKPKADALTAPTGTIYLNERLMKERKASPQDYADTLTHEFAHTKQAKQRGLVKQLMTMVGGSEPYGLIPDEIEAFQTEERRRERMGREPALGVPIADPEDPGYNTSFFTKLVDSLRGIDRTPRRTRGNIMLRSQDH